MTDRTMNIQQNRPELHVRHVLTWALARRGRVSDGQQRDEGGVVAAAPSAAAPRGRRGRDANLVPPGKNNWWR